VVLRRIRPVSGDPEAAAVKAVAAAVAKEAAEAKEAARDRAADDIQKSTIHV